MAASHPFIVSLLQSPPLSGEHSRSTGRPSRDSIAPFLLRLGTGILLASGSAQIALADGPDQPCVRTTYPSFLDLPAAPAVENLPVSDPHGIGGRWRRLIQTALRPKPKDFSWYCEYGTWACRYQQQDLVVWQRFPEEANAPEIVGTLVQGRLLVAPVSDLIVQGMAVDDPRPFTIQDLARAEAASHPAAPAAR